MDVSRTISTLLDVYQSAHGLPGLSVRDCSLESHNYHASLDYKRASHNGDVADKLLPILNLTILLCNQRRVEKDDCKNHQPRERIQMIVIPCKLNTFKILSL